MVYEIGFTTIMRIKSWYMMASEIANLDKVVAVTPQSIQMEVSKNGDSLW
jgi:hypothetical protein